MREQTPFRNSRSPTYRELALHVLSNLRLGGIIVLTCSLYVDQSEVLSALENQQGRKMSAAKFEPALLMVAKCQSASSSKTPVRLSNCARAASSPLRFSCAHSPKDATGFHRSRPSSVNS